MKKRLICGRDCSIFEGIGCPIEHRPHDDRGEVWAVLKHRHPLTNRQQRLLDSLPDTGSRVMVRKSGVSMSDLAVLTAEIRDEFAMFTCGSKRLIMRGDRLSVFVSEPEIEGLAARGYKWSGHTHTGCSLVPSEGDYDVLAYFAQEWSIIYNIEGKRNMFYNRKRETQIGGVVCTSRS